MYYLPTSCLFLFFLFSSFHPLPYASSKQELGWCEAQFQCGDITAGFPFSGGSRPQICGHPSLVLHCFNNKTSIIISDHFYNVLHIDQTSNTLRLARAELEGSFCNATYTATTLPSDIFELSSTYTSLTVFYLCDPKLSYRSSYTCPGRGLISVSQNLDYKYSCQDSFTINVPKSFVPEEKELNLRKLEKAFQEGFEVKVKIDEKACQKCSSSGGICGFENSTQICCKQASSSGCNKLHPLLDDKGLSNGAKAGIAVASVSGLAILILAGVFLCIRRRRKTQDAEYTNKSLPITSYSSRETSRNPTSTTISYSSNHSFLPSISNLANGSDYYGVQVFSYEELEEATENFSRELGDGGFGTVYYGVLKDGRAVAVKRLYERSLKRVEQFKNEIEILKSLKHPNLVILYGCTSRHSRELLLVYEYISNGTLAEHLHGNRAETRPLCWSTRLNIAIQTASALSYLHKSEVIHRDVKTTNILLDDNYQVKVADFGLSRLFPMDQTHISTAPQGTPGYVDPEYYQCYSLNEKSDVYSFGVVLSELISSKEAVDITRHRHDINLANMAVSKIQNNALHELVDSSLGFDNDPEVRRKMMSVAELAFRCLQQEREVRPSMDEIVEILRGVKEEEEKRVLVKSPDVVDIECGGGDDVGLLRNSVPPPISPETDKWTSSSDTAASL
ncbi:LEAF RUST 10 DISEASE-RESISTANCE LOCUS RECEPTOR-LIKE PROTEIN KINASE-like 1.4 isoform X1 [Arabidopsis lyrata subsp. lyrata]|uniref:LEAF RUST 10 DISEASE-RESISTANCE LOCUS RECEPTOR-LIKE PROTEIN KINASE-like 1.4 isoform X1 n=1 Tax=Arabidopsis lyrata subsp. lyrata TaxID=81972 RepID=UPI000A29B31B|nr:LEAF RUST 10 DISEASE-RESISTANCE LOCUS RECEPTOR-LIKE PROTEIN KINASE-like 1.4 isoform X1 [Arabidopsis lyrata subsp. lyrata]|eukprot:XP_020890250.1 LEAF RUST 10 DISEASE-RESISTANCE LOCUS RECEPTOR-LIKE PROTEIN KINASE-like 1.4 isoform X1 [Arabidopsis lyrata subsp. lyrata]